MQSRERGCPIPPAAPRTATFACDADVVENVHPREEDVATRSAPDTALVARRLRIIVADLLFGKRKKWEKLMDGGKMPPSWVTFLNGLILISGQRIRKPAGHQRRPFFFFGRTSLTPIVTREIFYLEFCTIPTYPSTCPFPPLSATQLAPFSGQPAAGNSHQCRPCPGGAQAKHADLIPTLWASVPTLVLGMLRALLAK